MSGKTMLIIGEDFDSRLAGTVLVDVIPVKWLHAVIAA
jgi:hypothetical protein